MSQKVSEVIIELNSFNLFLRKNLILKNINFKCFKGDKIGLIGPNGSGKTCFLRTIANIYQSNLFIKNNISFFYFGALGTVLNGNLTVIECVRRILFFYNYQIENINELNEYLNLLDLIKYKDYKYSELSTGYKLRVQITAFFILKFNYFCMDEFIGFGDKFLINNFKNLLHSKFEVSSTYLIASHNMDLIHKFCNRIVEIDNGSIINDYRIDSPK